MTLTHSKFVPGGDTTRLLSLAAAQAGAGKAGASSAAPSRIAGDIPGRGESTNPRRRKGTNIDYFHYQTDLPALGNDITPFGTLQQAFSGGLL